MTFATPDLAVFADFSGEDSADRRMLRVAGRMDAGHAKAPVELFIEAQRPTGLARPRPLGALEANPRGWQVHLVAPAALVERLERAFLSPLSVRCVLTLTLADSADPQKGAPIVDASLLMTRAEI